VERLVGPVLASASSAEVSVEGRIQPRRGGFIAHVVVSDAQGVVLGERELSRSAADCRELDEAISFVIAVTVDPNVALAQLPGELADEEHPEAKLLEELEAQPPVPPGRAGLPLAARAKPALQPEASGPKPLPTQESPPWHVHAALGGSLGLGTLDRASAGPSLTLVVRAGAWSVLAHGAYWPTQRIELAQRTAATLESWQAALTGCRALWRVDEEAVLDVCAGVALSPIRAEPRGFGAARSRLRVGPELAARASARIFGPLDANLLAAVQALWPRNEFTYEAGAEQLRAYRTPPIMAVFMFGLGVTF
jgi:hypothetical protein